MTDPTAASHGVTGELGWLVDGLAERVPEVRHVVLLSADGMLIAGSRGLSRDDADHLCAVAAGFQSLARGAGDRFACGEVRQTVVDMTQGFLFVTAAGPGARLAVLAEPNANAGMIAYEMSMLVQRVGEHMSARPRYEALS